MTTAPNAAESHISRMLSAYHEPVRRGTPRGCTVGLSKRKLYAALTAGLPVSLITRAVISGVSYGLLRKWRVEPAFREEEARARREVAHL